MPVVDTTQSFNTGDTVTSTTLNNIMDQSIFVAGAVVSGSGLAITAGGQMTTSNIPGANIAGTSITDGKIATGTITPVRLSAGAPNWTTSTTLLGNAVTGSYTASITPARTGDGSTTLQFGAQSGVSNSASITRNTGANGTFAITNTGTGAIAFSASGGVTFGSANMPIPSGSAPIFGCRAWVNFDAQSNADIAGTYSRPSSTTVTITVTSHGLIAGNLVFIDFTVGTGTAPFDGIYEVASVTDANTFTITSTASVASTGTATLKRKTIRGSGNISCISAAAASPVIPPTSNDTVANGYYIANFPIAMSNSNFAILGTCSESGNLSSGSGNDILAGTPYNEKSALITTISGGGTAIDALQNSVSIIG